MKTHIQIAIAALMLSVSTLSCSLFDSGTEWKDGPYALLWIDIPADVTLSYSNNQRAWSPLVEKQVFAVGSDSRLHRGEAAPGCGQIENQLLCSGSIKG